MSGGRKNQRPRHGPEIGPQAGEDKAMAAGDGRDLRRLADADFQSQSTTGRQ
jgi:hypothetical protein